MGERKCSKRHSASAQCTWVHYSVTDSRISDGIDCKSYTFKDVGSSGAIPLDEDDCDGSADHNGPQLVFKIKVDHFVLTKVAEKKVVRRYVGLVKGLDGEEIEIQLLGPMTIYLPSRAAIFLG